MIKTIKIITTIEEIDKGKCDYCEDIPNATHTLTVRNTRTNKLVVRGQLCPSCKTKAEKKELKECENCERVFKKGERNWSSCYCDGKNDEDEEIEPERYTVKLEKQVHEISLEKSNIEKELKTEREAHLEAVDTTARWYKDKHKEEIDALEEKRRRLSNENRNLKLKVEGIEKELEDYKVENTELKSQVQTLKSEIIEQGTKIDKLLDITPQQEAQIEVLPK